MHARAAECRPLEFTPALSCLALRSCLIRRKQKDITTARESEENGSPRTGALMLAVARGKVSQFVGKFYGKGGGEGEHTFVAES